MQDTALSFVCVGLNDANEPAPATDRPVTVHHRTHAETTLFSVHRKILRLNA